MAYQQQRLLADFDALLSQLGSWPNDSIIYDLTAFLDCGKQSAIELSDCLVARIMNPAIGQEYKFPLFCLLDSVVCGVPEPYASLFSHVIVDMFKYVFENVINNLILASLSRTFIHTSPQKNLELRKHF